MREREESKEETNLPPLTPPPRAPATPVSIAGPPPAAAAKSTATGLALAPVAEEVEVPQGPPPPTGGIHTPPTVPGPPIGPCPSTSSSYSSLCAGGRLGGTVDAAAAGGGGFTAAAAAAAAEVARAYKPLVGGTTTQLRSPRPPSAPAAAAPAAAWTVSASAVAAAAATASRLWVLKYVARVSRTSTPPHHITPYSRAQRIAKEDCQCTGNESSSGNNRLWMLRTGASQRLTVLAPWPPEHLAQVPRQPVQLHHRQAPGTAAATTARPAGPRGRGSGSGGGGGAGRGGGE